MLKYGGNSTYHDTNHISVEVDEAGEVVAVWFRCMRLPFVQSSADTHRAHEMRESQSESKDVKIHAIEYEK